MKQFQQDHPITKETPIVKEKEIKIKNKFKTLKLTESGVRTIGIAQSNFENFWSQIDKIDATKYEKQECLDKLKEACFWLSRGIAKYHEIKEE